MYNLGGNRRWVPLTGAAVYDFSNVIQWLNVVELAKTSQIRRLGWKGGWQRPLILSLFGFP